MKRLQAAAAALLLSMGWVGGVNAQAQAYPSKPIRIVVPYGAGGGIDVISRLVGERLSQRLGQPVLIDNRPGGGTLLGAEQVAKSAPDGYKIGRAHV